MTAITENTLFVSLGLYCDNFTYTLVAQFLHVSDVLFVTLTTLVWPLLGQTKVVY